MNRIEFEKDNPTNLHLVFLNSIDIELLQIFLERSNNRKTLETKAIALREEAK